MDDLNLLQNRCSIIGDDDLSFTVLDHFVHASWAQTGPYNIGERYFEKWVKF